MPAQRSTTHLICGWLAVLAIVGGGLTLLGWATGVRRLAEWFGNGIPQLPNNALATVLAGMALWLLSRGRNIASLLPSVMVAAIGGATLFEHLGGGDLGIDRLLLTQTWGLDVSAAPGRMGLPAATSFTIIGTSLVCASFGGTRGVAAVGAQVALCIAGLSLIGYLLGAQPLYAIPRFTVISLQSTLTLILVGAGLLLAMDDRQPMRSILAETAASRLVRRVFPGILLVPVALAWVALRGLDTRLYDQGFAMAAVVLGVMLVMTALLWWSAAAVSEHESELRASRERLAMSLAELERQDRRKDEFLATLAHELRNPLAPIRTGLTVLERSAGNPEVEATTRAMMERQVRQMVRLIDDLLDLSRITRDRIELRLAPVTVREILDQSMEACAHQVEAAGQQLVLELPDRSTQVHGDAARLVQVFSNLISNASKFTPSGGRITIRGAVDGTMFRVAVRDTGKGISPDRLDEVFEMFNQLAPPLDRAHGGLGIGLTLSRRLVEMHGGKLSAASEGEGKGSEFTVWLPVMAAPADAAGETPADA